MKKISPSDNAENEDWLDEESAEPLSFIASIKDPAEKYAASQLRVVRETRDYQLDYLKHALQPGKEIIDTAPGYQRRLRWTNKKRSLLIESFLLNIPVPPIFLFEKDYGEYEVVDGRQRIETVHSFFSNEFPLNGLEYWPELDGKRFTELPMVLQRGLMRRSISAVVLLAETGAGANELDVRRILFDRLNTGGIKLNPQELRNALYPGALNALLTKLARSEYFTAAWDIPKYQGGEESQPSEDLLKNSLFATLGDAELVLRFFALRDAYLQQKSGSLRRILDRYMESNKNIDELQKEELSAIFLTSIQRLYDLFDGAPFRLPKTRRLSRPLYDALMIALSINTDSDIENRKNAIHIALADALGDDERYEVLIGRGNTIEAVRQRIELAGKILEARG